MIVKRLVCVLLILTIMMALCGCENSDEKARQQYKEGFLDGWESAMDRVAESGAIGFSEDAKYYLKNGNREELEDAIQSAIDALYDVLHSDPYKSMN